MLGFSLPSMDQHSAKRMVVVPRISKLPLSSEQRQVEEMARSLSAWMGVVLKIEGLLNWENPRLLLVCLTTITSLFALFHVLNPSVLAIVGWLGLMFSFIGYAGPKISAR